MWFYVMPDYLWGKLNTSSLNTQLVNHSDGGDILMASLPSDPVANKVWGTILATLPIQQSNPYQ